MKSRPLSEGSRLHADFATRKEAIRTRLQEFSAVPPEDYFYELVYCLLTPQSSAVHAGVVVTLLRESDVLHRDLPMEKILRERSHYIRFHNTKSQRIREARARIAHIVLEILNTPDSPKLRAWLVANVQGLGWKEASHFLRNIGRRDLAILDRHILKNLVRFKVIRSTPKTLTPKRYLAIEKKFAKFAAETGITMDELDLLFWSRETGQILK